MTSLDRAMIVFVIAFFLGSLWGGFLTWIVIKKQLFKEKD